MPYVISIVADRIEREYYFEKTPIVIGRLQRNDIYIKDNSVSRQHARVIQDGDHYAIEDLNSTNFVYLNRKKVLKEILTHGDIINVGGAANLIFLLRRDAQLIEKLIREITDNPEFSGEALKLKQTMASLAGELAGHCDVTAPGEHTAVESGELSRTLDDFQALYEISYCINSTLRLEQVLPVLLSKLLGVFKADRGCIMLRNAATRQLAVALALNADGAPSQGEFDVEFANRAIDTGRPLLSPEPGKPEAAGPPSLVAPLRVKSNIIGVVLVEARTRPGPFSRKDLLLLEAISHQAAVAIDNARLTEDLKDKQRKLRQTYEDLLDRSKRLQITNEKLDQKVAELEALNAVSRGMNMVSDLDSVLKLILEKMVDLLRAERGSLMLCNEETGVLDAKLVLGLPPGEEVRPGGPKLRIGDGIAGLALRQGSPVSVADGHRNDLFKSLMERDRNIRSLLCVPLVLNDRRIGVINLTNRRDSGSFSEQDKPLAMNLANQAAITIENARLYNLAIFDGLTNLHVHRYFQVWLEKEFERTRRFEAPLSLVMLDIDNFKNVNDTYGHQFGDVILQEVASLVRKSVRTVDLAARYGGEEFAVILPETDSDGAQTFAERLRQRIAGTRYCYQETVLPVTVSIGIATHPRNHARNKDQLIGYADRALYHSKSTGKNKVSLYLPEFENEGDLLSAGDAGEG